MEDSLPADYLIYNKQLLRNKAIQQVTNEYGKNLLDIGIGSQLRLRIMNGHTMGILVVNPHITVITDHP